MAKEQFSIQYFLKSIPEALLWSFISDDAALSTWFADEVISRGDRHEFIWDGFSEYADLVAYEPLKYIRFHRDGDDEEDYWELRISIDELTDQTVLTVTDSAEIDELEDDIELWNAQIDQLRERLGCR